MQTTGSLLAFYTQNLSGHHSMVLACTAGCEGYRQVCCEHREGSRAVHQRPAGAHPDQGQLCGPGGHHCHQGHLPALPQPVGKFSRSI